MFDISIVFVNHYSKKELTSALASLMADLATGKTNAHITVVDNSANNDGIKDELSLNFPKVKYLPATDNQGLSSGLNLGFKAVPARYYLTLNPDILIPENSNTIERLVKFMDANPKIGAIGPKLVYPDGTLQNSCYRFDRPSILVKPFKHLNWETKYALIKKYADRLEMRDFDHNETRPVDWVMGSAIMARDEAVRKVGWPDKRYFLYFEDCDWCQSFWENGWPVYYVHDIVIQHRHARESAEIPGIFTALIRNRLARIHLSSMIKYLWKWRQSHKYYAKLS